MPGALVLAPPSKTAQMSGSSEHIDPHKATLHAPNVAQYRPGAIEISLQKMSAENVRKFRTISTDEEDEGPTRPQSQEKRVTSLSRAKLGLTRSEKILPPASIDPSTAQTFESPFHANDNPVRRGNKVGHDKPQKRAARARG